MFVVVIESSAVMNRRLEGMYLGMPVDDRRVISIRLVHVLRWQRRREGKPRRKDESSDRAGQPG